MTPLVVVDHDGCAAASALLTCAGWTVVDDVPSHPWDLAGHGLAFVSPVHDVGDAARVVEVAARGAAVVVACAVVPLSEVLVEDLARVGAVELWDGTESLACRLSLEQVQLLAVLGDGRPLGAAAARLHLSRRTADRRIAEARRVLGVRSTAEAMLIVGAELDRLAPTRR